MGRVDASSLFHTSPFGGFRNGEPLDFRELDDFALLGIQHFQERLQAFRPFGSTLLGALLPPEGSFGPLLLIVTMIIFNYAREGQIDEPAARLIIFVVLWPSTNEIEKTLPPRARTSSAPTIRSTDQSPPLTRTSGLSARMS